MSKSKKNLTSDKQQATSDKIIAIDGPAGSGKSTVARGLARRLGFLYIDTGAMYRALTLKAIREGLDLNDERALERLARETDIRLSMQKDILKVFLGSEDVSRAIRRQEVTEKVRFIAKVAGVRAEMVKLQRKLAENSPGAVLEGRDIGTVVFPGAKYKFYLDARIEERIKRRFKELSQVDRQINREEIARDIAARDKSDMTRKVAPLIKAEDAVYIDTTDLNIEQVVEKIAQRCSI